MHGPDFLARVEVVANNAQGAGLHDLFLAIDGPDDGRRITDAELVAIDLPDLLAVRDIVNGERRIVVEVLIQDDAAIDDERRRRGTEFRLERPHRNAPQL